MTQKTTFVSLLRAVNVGGRAVRKEGLIHLYESLGYTEVRTYLQSGNIIFSVGTKPIDTILTAEILEKNLLKTFGFEVSVILRTKEDIGRIIRNNPLSQKDEDYLHVTFLREGAKHLVLSEIEKAKTESEEYSISKSEIYLYCPYGYGRTKLNNTFFERKLGVLATTRNWRTVKSLTKA